jgi:hypothetical protein
MTSATKEMIVVFNFSRRRPWLIASLERRFGHRMSITMPLLRLGGKFTNKAAAAAARLVRTRRASLTRRSPKPQHAYDATWE